MFRTWRTMIAEALVRSGYIGRGQTANENLFKEGEISLSFLLDELDGGGVLMPLFSVLTFNTIANQAMYLLGTSAVEVAGATAIRPLQIITGTVNIGGNPPVFVPMREVYPNFATYQTIAVPSTGSQPWNYSINPKFPQSELFLYPTPYQIYPITLTCKIKWEDTVGAPDANPFAIAEVSQGYYNGICDILSLRLAEKQRLDTDTLQNKARTARHMMLAYVARQIKPTLPAGVGVFPWVRGLSGVNP